MRLIVLRSVATSLVAGSISGSALAQAPAAADPTAANPTAGEPVLAPAEAPAPSSPNVQASAQIGGTTSADFTADAGESSGPVSESLAGRFQGGFRSGFSLGLGKAGNSVDVKDIAQWRAPFWLDVGYRISEPFWLGVYGQLGVGPNGDACAGACNWNDLRLGAQIVWHTAPGAGSEGWLGLGVGYEWLSVYSVQVLDVPISEDVPELGVRTSRTVGGPELLLQAGWDIKLEPNLAVGPYVAASFGKYLSGDGFFCDIADVDCDISGDATHAWLGAGLRGTYAP
jgi:hypothetical protein